MSIQPISNEDIIVWPDGTWCARGDLAEYQHMSDDYIVLPDGSIEWHNHAKQFA